MNSSLQYGDRIKAVVRDGHNYVVTLKPEGRFETHHGFIPHESIIQTGFGTEMKFPDGERVFFFPCGIVDTIMKLERRTQIVYPKDIGLIGLMMDVKAGDRIVEAGMGSGAMSIFFSRSIGDSGILYSYERNPDFLRIGMNNLHKAGTLHRVVIHYRDLAEGVFETNADSFFLDVPDPQNHVLSLKNALKKGGTCVIVCPTFNQCEEVLQSAQANGFMDMQMWEIFYREYKVNPDRIRPQDRMIAHTAFMLSGKNSY